MREQDQIKETKRLKNKATRKERNSANKREKKIDREREKEKERNRHKTAINEIREECLIHCKIFPDFLA